MIKQTYRERSNFYYVTATFHDVRLRSCRTPFIHATRHPSWDLRRSVRLRQDRGKGRTIAVGMRRVDYFASRFRTNRGNKTRKHRYVSLWTARFPANPTRTYAPPCRFSLVHKHIIRKKKVAALRGCLFEIKHWCNNQLTEIRRIFRTKRRKNVHSTTFRAFFIFPDKIFFLQFFSMWTILSVANIFPEATLRLSVT